MKQIKNYIRRIDNQWIDFSHVLAIRKSGRPNDYYELIMMFRNDSIFIEMWNFDTYELMKPIKEELERRYPAIDELESLRGGRKPRNTVEELYLEQIKHKNKVEAFFYRKFQRQLYKEREELIFKYFEESR